MELVPIITTLLTYGVIILSTLIIISYTVSKYRNTANVKISSVQYEEPGRRIIRRKMNDAQVRILADKEEIKQNILKYTSKEKAKVKSGKIHPKNLLTVINSPQKSRYEVLNERKTHTKLQNIYSVIGNF
jgi:hypothetical protein